MTTTRELAIDAAADLVRTGGPNAVTTVAVSRQIGIRQSGVYRHVRDVSELRTIAIHRVVRELDDDLASIVTAAAIDRDLAAGMERFLGRLVAALARHASTLELIDRWRFEDGQLGEGIRAILQRGRDGIATLLAQRRAVNRPEVGPLTATQRSAGRAHAQLIQDDILGVARLMRSQRLPGGRRGAAELLGARAAVAGYRAYLAALD